MKTMEVLGGKRMLVAEPVDFCGIDTFDDLSVAIIWLKKCRANMLHSIAMGYIDDVDEDDMWGMENVEKLINRMEAYRLDYLTDRIHALEAHCGLAENGDVDSFHDVPEMTIKEGRDL